MKKITLILLFFFISISLSFANISGNWLLLKMESKGKVIQDRYMILELKKDGQFVIMGIPFGTWKLKDKYLQLNSKMDKDFNGDAKILKLDDKNLIINNKDIIYTYLRVNQDDINNKNSTAPFIGVWKFSNDGMDYILKFEKPDKFMVISTGDGSTTTYRGNWIYNPSEKSIIVISFFRELRGKIFVKQINKNEFIFTNKNKIYKAQKENSSPKIERLTFNFEDFPEEVSETEISKLPWREFYEMTDFLSKISQIEYKRSELIVQTNTFKNSKIISKISVDTKKPKVDFRNFLVDKGKEEQFSEKVKGGLTNRYNNFFPREEPFPYKIIENQMVNVPAGKFNCTVIEGFDGENKIKYWMINDKPGIYAKIIIEGVDPFGKLSYEVLELKKIIFK